MKRLAIIDIGSNTIRLVILETDKQYFRIIDESKNTTKLGKSTTDGGALNNDAIDKAVQGIKEFCDLCSVQKVEQIYSFATEAVRKAPNKHLFIGRVKEETGIDIKVLSGEEEAYYDYFSIVNTMDIDNCLMIDIGGSSTEFGLIKNRKLVNSISIPLGSINLNEKFSFAGIVDEKLKNKFKNYIYKELDKIEWLKEAEGLPLVGIGGTIRTLSKIHKIKVKYPLDLLHNYCISTKDVDEIFEQLSSLEPRRRSIVKGLPKDRADAFLGSLTFVENIIAYCSVNKIMVNGHGVREGFIYQQVLEDHKPLEDILDYSLRNIMVSHPLTLDHGLWIQETSFNICNGLKGIVNFDGRKMKILKTAALLHDIGKEISYYDFHKHSFYIIMNLDIDGLNHGELLLAAFTAALGGKGKIKLTNEQKNIIKEEDLRDAEILSVILRLSNKLDRGYNQIIDKVCAFYDDNFVTIRLNSKINPSIEINAAGEIKKDIERLFNRKLVIL